MGNANQNYEQCQINHEKFINCQTNKQTQRIVASLSVPIQQEAFKDWEQMLSEIKANKFSDFLYLPIKQQFNSSNILCSSNDRKKVQLTFEDYPYVLDHEIKQRVKKNFRFLEQEQLWLILFSLVVSQKVFKQSSTERIGNVEPHNIFINEMGEIKIACQYTWPDQSTNFEKAFYNKQSFTYLAPQQLYLCQTKQKRHQNRDQIHSAESYSIGLTVLSAGLLDNFSQLVDPHTLKFSNSYLQYALEKWNGLKYYSDRQLKPEKYSNDLRQIISKMCDPNPKTRLIGSKVYQMLEEHEFKIRRLESFKIHPRFLEKAQNKRVIVNQINNHRVFPVPIEKKIIRTPQFIKPVEQNQTKPIKPMQNSEQDKLSFLKENFASAIKKAILNRNLEQKPLQNHDQSGGIQFLKEIIGTTVQTTMREQNIQQQPKNQHSEITNAFLQNILGQSVTIAIKNKDIKQKQKHQILYNSSAKNNKQQSKFNTPSTTYRQKDVKQSIPTSTKKFGLYNSQSFYEKPTYQITQEVYKRKKFQQQPQNGFMNNKNGNNYPNNMSIPYLQKQTSHQKQQQIQNQSTQQSIIINQRIQTVETGWMNNRQSGQPLEHQKRNISQTSQVISQGPYFVSQDRSKTNLLNQQQFRVAESQSSSSLRQNESIKYQNQQKASQNYLNQQIKKSNGQRSPRKLSFEKKSNKYEI